MPRYSSTGKNLSAMVHADRSWTCPCGKVVYGNGGKASHGRACLPALRQSLGSAEKMLTYHVERRTSYELIDKWTFEVERLTAAISAKSPES
jgi:hypothetical protein